MPVEVVDKRLQATHHLDWYIPNELTWEDPWGRYKKWDKEKQESFWKETKVSGIGEQILINALREIVQDKTGRGIILLASRGSGKTVASYRCEHLLANASTSREIFGGSRPLVFRWAKANWPTTTADNLIDLVSADSKLKEFLNNKTGLRDVSQLCRSLAEYAFDEERLVIIIDAYDELDEKQKASLRTVHAQALQDTKKVLWIITSRDYAVNEEKETFFKEDVFRRIRLQPFSRELQNQFMERALSPMVKSWREDCFKDSGEDWDKQLGTPLTLRQVAVMINESKSKKFPLPSFSSLSDLFVQSSDRLIDREFDERNLPQEKQRIDGRSLTAPLRREYLERALGAIAFELAVRGIWKEVIGTTDQITEVIGEAKKRFLLGFRESGLDARHNPDRSWEWAYDRIGEFEINNGVFQADINKEVLSFTTRHVQEMRCARYLAKYATATDLRDETSRDRCALGRIVDKSWQDIWWGVIKMPLDASNPHESGRYFEALKVLFERPMQVDQRRPTELMWDCDRWIKSQHGRLSSLRGLDDRLRDHLRSQFLRILKGEEGGSKQRIAEDLIDENNFVLLADPECKRDELDTGVFVRQVKDAEGGYKDHGKVKLTRYQLCKYAISNEQFQLFDANFNQSDKNDLKRFGSANKPAVFVSWFDCYWFSEFVVMKGASWQVVLPTEAQWEYGARAGSRGLYFRGPGGVEVTEDELREYEHYGQAWETEVTLTVRGHGKRANAWGLEMMAGNVWERCSDWYDDYPEGDVTDPSGPEEGSYRVSRGGGFSSEAAGCRSAYRDRDSPDNRNDILGFRVALSPSGIPKSPEAGQGTDSRAEADR